MVFVQQSEHDQLTSTEECCASCAVLSMMDPLLSASRFVTEIDVGFYCNPAMMIMRRLLGLPRIHITGSKGISTRTFNIYDMKQPTNLININS